MNARDGGATARLHHLKVTATDPATGERVGIDADPARPGVVTGLPTVQMRGSALACRSWASGRTITGLPRDLITNPQGISAELRGALRWLRWMPGVEADSRMAMTDRLTELHDALSSSDYFRTAHVMAEYVQQRPGRGNVALFPPN